MKRKGPRKLGRRSNFAVLIYLQRPANKLRTISSITSSDCELEGRKDTVCVAITCSRVCRPYKFVIRHPNEGRVLEYIYMQLQAYVAATNACILQPHVILRHQDIIFISNKYLELLDATGAVFPWMSGVTRGKVQRVSMGCVLNFQLVLHISSKPSILRVR